MLPKLYKTLFWIGYTAVLITSMLSLPWHLDKIHLGTLKFYIRMDHLLHLGAYLLICMYFLFGRKFGLKLFENHSFRKFLILILTLATVTEFIQIWVPERAFNVMDWVANVAGIFLGVVIIKIQDQRKF